MITQFDRNKPVKNLPDAYYKAATSNNAKLLDIEYDAVGVLRNEVNAIYDSLDIYKAYGKTLDMYGEIFGQLRGKATDEQYRILIKNRIIRNFCNADYNSLVNAICATFNCGITDIQLTELDDPCKLRLEKLPITKLVESNIDINTAVQIVQGLMPAGVQMEAIDFTGTFEFSGGIELIYDEATGFADDNQTIGGYLGLMAGSNTSQDTGWLDGSYTAVLGKAVIGRMRLGES
jgi:hypothetical protein